MTGCLFAARRFDRATPRSVCAPFLWRPERRHLRYPKGWHQPTERELYQSFSACRRARTSMNAVMRFSDPYWEPLLSKTRKEAATKRPKNHKRHLDFL